MVNENEKFEIMRAITKHNVNLSHPDTMATITTTNRMNIIGGFSLLHIATFA